MFALLLACSSVTLLGSDSAESVRVDALADPTACESTCETLWTPLPVCAAMAAGSDPALTVEACQADCDRADVYAEAIHSDVDDAWAAAIAGYMESYAGDDECSEAVQRAGGTPCSHSEVYCDPPA